MYKWFKQHLKIKRFWGTTENAVRIQISVAIITYCLVAIVQHDMQLKRSTYEVLQILSISLTDKTHLRDLFDKTNFNDVKDLSIPLIPGLFDYFLTRPDFNGTLMCISIKVLNQTICLPKETVTFLLVCPIIEF